MQTSPEVLAPMSLAERKRQLVRDQLCEAALRLLAGQGYEETTIEQVVAAAGVSRRTFFRYFKSKEDVIVESVADMSTAVRAALAARPARENPQTAIRAALSETIDEVMAEPAKAVPLIRLLFDTPALRRRYLERQSILQGELAAELARREGLDEREDRDDLGPALAAGVAITAFMVAIDSWARHGGDGDLNALIDEAFARTNPGAAVRKGRA
jgi:AcrR family transcriptional regulator